MKKFVWVFCLALAIMSLAGNCGPNNDHQTSSSPTSPPSSTDVKYFQYVMRDDPNEWFIVKMTSPDTIQQALNDLNGERRLIVSGIVNSGNEGFNSPWSWHLDPATIILGENFIELCDARPSYVESHLSEWLGQRYCPWGARINTAYDAPPATPPATVAYQLDWVNFGPYMNGQNPNWGSVVSEQQIRDRLKIIAPYVKGIRSFGSTQGLEHLARIAKQEFGLKTAIGAWLSKDQAANNKEMVKLIAAAKAGYVDIAIVGSEVLYRNDLNESELLYYLQQFKTEVPSVLVTTGEIYNFWIDHPNLVNACDVIFANYYPYWEGKEITSAVAYVHAYHLEVKANANGKKVYVSETGWPSDGNIIGKAVPNPGNAALYFLNSVSWARSQGVELIYFEAFDETWKELYEGPQGAHWGIFTKDGVLKPGMQDVFDGKTVADNWSCNAPVGGPATPQIVFTYVPAVGSFDNLLGQVWHVVPTNYRVAVYIKVYGGWWIKPYFSMPLTVIGCDGKWETDITTGGVDQLATEIAAYLVPLGYNPPLAGGGALPETELSANSVAHIKVTR